MFKEACVSMCDFRVHLTACTLTVMAQSHLAQQSADLKSSDKPSVHYRSNIQPQTDSLGSLLVTRMEHLAAGETYFLLELKLKQC